MERWQRIDCAPAAEAAGELRICCGAERWVSRMLARRPFGSLEAARAAAREEWFALSTDDWKQAFVHHPRIGDRSTLRARFGEAAAVSSARESNREYESRFGYLFIVCATGKTAEQMLQILRERLTNHPDEEMLIAAAEHAKICDSRLAAVV